MKLDYVDAENEETEAGVDGGWCDGGHNWTQCIDFD